MGLVITPSIDSLKQRLESARKRVDFLVFRALSRLGMEVVDYVRDRPQDISWYDHSGNLRSSIGYVIAKDGNVVDASAFVTVKGGTEGASEGRDFATQMAVSHKRGWALVVVAGMNYASFVESIEGKDVLAGGRSQASMRLAKYAMLLKQQIMQDRAIKQIMSG